MKSISLIFTLSIFTGLLLAQDYSLDYAKVTKHELETKEYPYDKEAAAAVLFDIGETKFILNSDGYFNLTTERTVKIKIYSEAGFDYGQIEIPYYDEGFKKEHVEDIEATTYNLNENGQITLNKVNKEDIFTEQVSPKYKLIKFAMPNLQVGSVIEFKYTLVSPYIFGYYDWEFQTDIPTRYSKYKAHMIPFYTYTYILQGASKFDYFTSYEAPGLTNSIAGLEYKDIIYEFVMDHVPAFKDEGFITSTDDYILKLDFQLSVYNSRSGTKTEYLTTWPDMSKDLLISQKFGGFIDAAARKTKSIVQQFQNESSNKRELVEKISDYVKSNYSWDNQNRYSTDDNVKKFLDRKKGSSADINLFMLGMLQNTGIVAKPVILSTRDHGKVKIDYPFAHFFNYVVAYVELENINLLMDATNPLLPFYLLPVNCLNEQGLVIDKKEPFWVNLQQSKASSIHHTMLATPEPESDSLSVIVSTISTLYDANHLRRKINDNQENLVEFIENKGITLLHPPSTRNYFEKEKNYTINYKGNVPLGYIGNKIYIAPFLSEPPSENPFKSTERNYPVDLTYARKRTYKCVINIPEGYKADYLPENKSIDNVLFSFNYKVNQLDMNNKISVEADYYFKKAVYDVKEYNLIRYYYMQLTEKLNDKVSLVRIEK